MWKHLSTAWAEAQQDYQAWRTLFLHEDANANYSTEETLAAECRLKIAPRQPLQRLFYRWIRLIKGKPSDYERSQNRSTVRIAMSSFPRRG